MRQFVSVFGFGCLALLPNFSAAQSTLEDFVTSNGVCDAKDYEKLISLSGGANEGFTVTTGSQVIKSGWLPALPFTNTEIPPFTPLRCFAERQDQVLVLAEDGATNYCGWVPRSALLREARADSHSTNGGNVFNRDGDVVCPTLEPLSVGKYCQIISDIGAYEPLCEDQITELGEAPSNPITTKFLTWNANAAEGEDRTEVPIFSRPDPDSMLPNALGVFDVMQVWDVESGADGQSYVLVGPSNSSVVGWVQMLDGTVWFSKLAVWFASKNDADILTAPPGTSVAETLAEAPPNIDEMLSGNADFPKFPVLVDNREAAAIQGTTQDPHLAIAFIGAVCSAGEICVQNDVSETANLVQLLKAVDVLFVIDATKSMQTYFDIVANAVETVTNEKASSAIRFGVVTYGDFLQANDQSIDADMQIETVIELTEIFTGDEFEDLRDADLFIEDALNDKPEGAFAALYQAIEEADWRLDEGLRFVIHIGDHGDRAGPPKALRDIFLEKQIFYAPIPVRGEYIANFNNDFVTQTQALVSALSVGDLVWGLSGEPTFAGGKEQSNAVAGREILRALRGFTEVSEIVTRDIANKILNRDVGSASGSSRYPAGFAQIVDTAKEIYGIDVDAVAEGIEQRTISAEGFIEVGLENNSQDWEYFAAIAPRDLGVLIQDFDLLCNSLGDSNAQEDLSTALRSVIEILTGDVLGNDNERFYRYFDDRADIPLVNRTILGDGILDLGRDLQRFGGEAAERVETYRKETCRTSRLLRLMDSDRMVPVPYEITPEGELGDLVWDASSSTYNDRRSRPFTWTTINVFNVPTVYLPLSYLPQPYDRG